MIFIQYIFLFGSLKKPFGLFLFFWIEFIPFHLTYATSAMTTPGLNSCAKCRSCFSLMDLLAEVRRNPFLLAPMAGITDCAFRSFMREMGCGAVVTELVSATGLQFNSEKTRKLMAFAEDQHPVGVQIFGDDPSHLAEAAIQVEAAGADFVDLNFGCPVPKVVKKGAGAATLKDLVHMREILRAIKKSVSIPVTIKIRTGWDEKSKNAIDVAQLAFDEGITWVAIHGRTRAAGYSGLADWDYISEVKAKSPLPIIGNGDIRSAEQALERLNQSGCDGVMIGRGCLKNPWVFREAMDLYQERPSEFERDFTWLFGTLHQQLLKYADDRIVPLQIKKLAAWYSAGYPASAQFRKEIFQQKDQSSVFSMVTDYFSTIAHLPAPDTSGEAFLMGGHG